MQNIISPSYILKYSNLIKTKEKKRADNGEN